MSDAVKELPIDRFREAIAICDRFEAASRRGEKPRPEDFLGLVQEADRLVLLRELLAIESELDAITPTGDESKSSSLIGSGQPIPTSVGDFDILGVIGRGGMGVVYRARQRGIGRVVALKLIRPDIAEALEPGQFEAVVSRFRDEARAAGGIRHENIVVVHAVGEDQGRY